MSYCPHCGASCKEDDRFCPACGRLLQQTPAPASAGFGIASLVLGILGLLTSWCFIGIVPAAAAIVFAAITFCSRPRRGGQGFAVAGLVLGILAAVIFVLVVLVFVVFASSAWSGYPAAPFFQESWGESSGLRA